MTKRHWARPGLGVLTAIAVALPWFVGATASDPGAGVADHLTRLRAVAGVGPVAQDGQIAGPAGEHAAYLADIGQLRHTQDPSHPKASPAGARAAKISVLDALNRADAGTRHLDRWISAPFHALELLHPGLSRVGFATAGGRHPGYAQVAVMDTRSGRDGAASGYVAWPGNGSTIDRTSFTSGETPDPLTACPGYALPTGHPAYLTQPQAATVRTTYLRTAGDAVDHCVITAQTYRNPDAAAEELGRSLLAAANAVVIIPRAPLAPGTYDVMVGTDAADVVWSFTVGTSLSGATETPRVIAPGTGEPLPAHAEAAHRTGDAPTIAASLSQRMLLPGTATGVVLCRSDVFADCLTASVAARPTVPILYGGPGTGARLPQVTADEIRRILPRGNTVTVVGGPAAISPETVEDLRALGYAVERISGRDRFETAAALQQRFAPGATRVLLARGDTWPDAVAVGGLAAATRTPVLLARPGELPGVTATALGSGVEVTLLGGVAALSDAVAEEVRQLTGATPRRISGDNRVATALAIHREWEASSSTRLVADLWPTDAWQPVLASAGLAAALGAPLLPLSGSELPPESAVALRDAGPVSRVLVLGNEVIEDLGGLVGAIDRLTTRLTD
jgi:putative cell wall-binding protein